jgi:hypothetical protein
MSLTPLVRSSDGWAVKPVLLQAEVPELGADSASSLRNANGYARDATGHVDGVGRPLCGGVTSRCGAAFRIVCQQHTEAIANQAGNAEQPPANSVTRRGVACMCCWGA